MFGRIFLKFFWDAYDFIGTLILANIAFCLITTGLLAALIIIGYPLYGALGKPVVLLALGLGIFLTFAIPFPAAGFLHFLSIITEEREPEWREVITGLKTHYAPLLKVTAFFVCLLELLAVNIIFYIKPSASSHAVKLLGSIIAGLCVWIFLYLLVMMLYAYPLTVHQRVGMKKIFIRSFLLTMDNLGASILTGILALGLCGLGLITRGVAVFLLIPALTACLANSLFVNVMEKYELKEAAQKEQKMPTVQPASWKDIKHEEFIRDRHKRYQRTLKDILKPWEY